MEAPAGVMSVHEGTRPTSVVLVWIDARAATIARWVDGEVTLERLESDVPAHHKSTGHVGHDPSLRHGGGGRQQAAIEAQRLEHLARFVEQVAQRLATSDAVAIIGPGTVRDHLDHVIREDDARHRRQRTVTCGAAARLTDPQLVARVRTLAGDVPRRRTVGAHRPKGAPDERPAGSPSAAPERIMRKPPRERIRLQDELADLDERTTESSTEAEASLAG